MSLDRRSDSTKTNEELFLASFEGEYEDEGPWNAVGVLRRRNSDEVFRLAAAYCRSEVPIHRARALDVLAQMGAGRPLPERPFYNASASLAISYLGHEDSLVVRSAAWALAHLQGDAATWALIGARKSADTQVRLAVANGMAGSEHPDAISTLMELMEDVDDEVRNWATFGLGHAGGESGPPVRLGTLDSPSIREALRSRLADSVREVRDEAVWGLALRKDSEGLRILLDRLSSGEWVAGDEMTAAEILELEYDVPKAVLQTGLRSLLADG
jgi:HEAT repeat protein